MENSLGQNFTFKTLIKFTSPIIFMLLFISFYQMTDGVIVSNLIGENALSAINIVYPVINVFIGVAIMLSSGGSAIVAKNMGEGDYDTARKNFSMILVVGVAISIIMSIIFLIFIKDIILILGATENLYGHAYNYLIVLLIFAPIAIMQMVFLIFLIACGKSFIGFMLTIIGGVSNIVLDYVFINNFSMGIEGAAIATVIGQAVTVVFCVYVFFFTKKLNLYFVKTKINFKIIFNACYNGASEMVSNLSNAVTTFMFNIIMLKLLGENGVASITIALYAKFMLTAVYIGFSSGVAPIFSFNYGNKNEKETKNVYRLSIRLIYIFSVITIICSFVFSTNFVSIFTEESSEVFSVTESGFKIFSLSFIFSGINIFASNLFTAFSNGFVSATISFLRTFVILVLCLIILPNMFGVNGVWVSVPISEAISAIVSYYFIYKNKNKYKYL